MFASAIFVLILFQADGAITYVPGWHSFRACTTGRGVIMNASESLYTQAAPKRPVAAYCVAQFGTGEESAP
jgi:hypothetical protein